MTESFVVHLLAMQVIFFHFAQTVLESSLFKLAADRLQLHQI